MITQIQIDDFHPCGRAIAALARTLKYGPQEHGGHVYKGIGLGYSPELFYETLSIHLGRNIKATMEYFRLGTKEDSATTYIHADSGCAKNAAVWYLSEPPDGMVAGTAFWRHRETGKDRLTDADRLDTELLAKLDADGADESKWIMTGLCGQKQNRLVTYPTDIFHSRYPQNAWGNDASDGRIVFTCFYD
jgi:hypothetical protein